MLRTSVSHVLLETENAISSAVPGQLTESHSVGHPVATLSLGSVDDTVNPEGFIQTGSAEQQSAWSEPKANQVTEGLEVQSDYNPQRALPKTPLPFHFVNGKRLAGVRLMNGRTVRVRRFISSLDNAITIDERTRTSGRKSVHVGAVQSRVARLAAVISDGPLLPTSEGCQLSVAIVPSMHPIHILQVDWNSGCCPANTFLMYMSQVVAEGAPGGASDEDIPSQYGVMVSLMRQLMMSK